MIYWLFFTFFIYKWNTNDYDIVQAQQDNEM